MPVFGNRVGHFVIIPYAEDRRPLGDFLYMKLISVQWQWALDVSGAMFSKSFACVIVTLK